MSDYLSFSERSMKWPPMFGRVPYERQSKSSDEQVERKILNDALGFTQRPHIQSILTPLQRPVGIPRLQSRVGAPFARLYAPELAQYDVPMEEFVEFIDNMNIVCADFVPLQILDAVGSLVGLVPNHWAQMAGAVTSLGSKVAVHAVSKIRGETFLRRVNSEYFNPRGLSVQMCTTDALVRLGHVPPEAAKMPPLDHVTATMSIEERRLSHLMPWLSPVTDQVPAPSPQTNKLKELCNKQAAYTSRRTQRKVMDDRFDAFEKQGPSPAEADQMFATLRAKGEFTPRQIGKMEKKYMKGERECSKDQREYEKKSKIEREAEKDIMKAHRKGKIEDLVKAERKRESELGKLDREYSSEQLKRQRSFEKEDKERKKGHKAVWLLVQTISQVPTLRS